LEGLFGWFGKVKAYFFGGVGVLIGLSLDTPVGRLLFWISGSQFVV
jgi:hypothetical protein